MVVKGCLKVVPAVWFQLVSSEAKRLCCGHREFAGLRDFSFQRQRCPIKGSDCFAVMFECQASTFVHQVYISILHLHMYYIYTYIYIVWFSFLNIVFNNLYFMIILYN